MASTAHVEDFFDTFSLAALQKDIAKFAKSGSISTFISVPHKRNVATVKPKGRLLGGSASRCLETCDLDFRTALAPFILQRQGATDENTKSSEIEAMLDVATDVRNPTQRQWDDLNQLRVHAGAPERSHQGIERLARYYEQLCHMDERFRMDESRFSARWFDSFQNNSKVTTPCFQYEKAATLFNIGSVYSFLAATQSSWTHEGLKMAALMFEKAAGSFALARDVCSPRINTKLSPHQDLHPNTLVAMTEIMLAQSHECYFQKANLDRASSNVTAQISAMTAEHYDVAYRASKVTGNALTKQRFDKKWISMLKSKSLIYTAIAHYHTAPQGSFAAGIVDDSVHYLDNDAKNKANNVIGERLARLMVAKSLADRAVKEAGHCGGSTQALVSNISGEITKALHTLESVNFENYHQVVIDPRFLHPLKRLNQSLVQPVLPSLSLRKHAPHMAVAPGEKGPNGYEEILFSHLKLEGRVKEQLDEHVDKFTRALVKLRATEHALKALGPGLQRLAKLRSKLGIRTECFEPKAMAKLHGMACQHESKVERLVEECQAAAQENAVLPVAHICEAFDKVTSSTQAWVQGSVHSVYDTSALVRLNSEIRQLRKRGHRAMDAVANTDFDLDEWNPSRIRKICGVEEILKHHDAEEYDFHVEEEVKTLLNQMDEIVKGMLAIQTTQNDVIQSEGLRVLLFNRDRDLQSLARRGDRITLEFSLAEKRWAALDSWAVQVDSFLVAINGAEDRLASFSESLISSKATRQELCQAMLDALGIRNEALSILAKSGIDPVAPAVKIYGVNANNARELEEVMAQADVVFGMNNEQALPMPAVPARSQTPPFGTLTRGDVDEHLFQDHGKSWKAGLGGISSNIKGFFDRRGSIAKPVVGGLAGAPPKPAPARSTTVHIPQGLRRDSVVQQNASVDAVKMCSELLRANKELRTQLDQRTKVVSSGVPKYMDVNESPIMLPAVSRRFSLHDSPEAVQPITPLSEKNANTSTNSPSVTPAERSKKKGRKCRAPPQVLDSGLGSSGVFDLSKDMPGPGMKHSATVLSETLSQLKQQSDKLVTQVVHSSTHSKLS